MRRTVSGALAVAAAVSCARPYAPPGGERDVVAPRLVETRPAALEVVTAGDFPVIFRFDETLSERGFSEALVTVSPLDSTLRVQRSGSEVRVRIDGGWRPDRVYRVVLLPGAADRFGNRRTEQAELVFSTGAPVGNTALAGMVLDRITGAPARSGVVNAVQRGLDVRYTAITDSSGFYSLRYLPVGEYIVSAFDDQNRNRRLDALEPVDSGHSVVFASPTDTVALVFRVLSPDTTAPGVAAAEAVDSMHVAIQLDDAVESTSLPDISVVVHRLPDSTSVAGARRVVSAAQFARELRLAADTLRADSVQVPVPAAPGIDLPVREIVVELDRPLPPGTYTITLTGIVNLHGITGAGVAQFELRPPALPPPDTVPAPPDTIPGSLRRWP